MRFNDDYSSIIVGVAVWLLLALVWLGGIGAAVWVIASVLKWTGVL